MRPSWIPLLPAAALVLVLGCRNRDARTSPPPAAPAALPPDSGTPRPDPDRDEVGIFEVQPYLQVGTAPDRMDRLHVLWHAREGVVDWAVERRTSASEGWVRMAPPTSLRVDIPATGVTAQRVWTGVLTSLEPGGSFDYRILQGERTVFQQSGARARVGAGQKQRIAIAGDLLEPSNPKARMMPSWILAHKPDLMVALGDLVYPHGTYREYREAFFPAYNGAPGAQGAPLMRSVPMVGVLGNHDVAHVGRRRTPPGDSLAYYYCWDQPLNGPDLASGGHVARLRPRPEWEPFLRAAGARYPTMGNFHVTSGDVRFVVLDSNRYIQWEDPALRAWIRQALDTAPPEAWRIVVFHHPGFNLAANNHTGDWHMRQLWPLFQELKVDLVMNGHLHAYERTTPFTFTPAPAGVTDAEHTADEAHIVQDLHFDGTTHTRAAGPIQIITGAAGGAMHTRAVRILASGPKPFHQTLVADRHSFSLLEIRGRKLDFRQVDENGAVVDRFTLTK